MTKTGVSNNNKATTNTPSRDTRNKATRRRVGIIRRSKVMGPRRGGCITSKALRQMDITLDSRGEDRVLEKVSDILAVHERKLTRRRLLRSSPRKFSVLLLSRSPLLSHLDTRGASAASGAHDERTIHMTLLDNEHIFDTATYARFSSTQH